MPLPLLALGLTGLGLKNLSDKVDEDRAPERQKAADDKARRAAVADVEPAIKEAADGIGPSAVMVGKSAYGTEKEAGDAAAAYNSPDAKIARLQGVMLNQADPDGAMRLEKNATDMKAYRQKAAKAMEDEGINSFIDTNLGAAPSVADIEGGKAGLFDLQGSDAYNAAGKSKIPDGAKGRWKVMDYGNGRKEADFEVLGPDGKPLAPSARTLQAIHAMSLHEREKQADERTDKARDNDRSDKQLKGQLDYWESLKGKADRWVPGGKGGSPFERMRQEDLEAYRSADARAKDIQKGIVDATMQQTWDPANNAGQRSLLLQMEQLQRQANDIVARYADASGAGTTERPKADPYGIRGAAEDQPAPKFDVRGDPAAFRRQLVAKGSAAALEAFDQQYPNARQQSPASGKLAATSPAASGLVIQGNALQPGASRLTGIPASMAPIVNRRSQAQNGVLQQIGEATRKRQQ